MAVTACAFAGQRSLAIKTLKDMKECGIHPDITVYHAVLSACARSVLYILFQYDLCAIAMLTQCTKSHLASLIE
jgi:pentatricopeptide repeat protein